MLSMCVYIYIYVDAIYIYTIRIYHRYICIYTLYMYFPRNCRLGTTLQCMTKTKRGLLALFFPRDPVTGRLEG